MSEPIEKQEPGWLKKVFEDVRKNATPGDIRAAELQSKLTESQMAEAFADAACENLRKELAEIRECLAWASENVGSCWISDDESHWLVDLATGQFTDTTLYQALFSAWKASTPEPVKELK